ncbi:hypothetical protein L0152_06810 [bacterium]|nr:hypothetical protein [bacterium]
MKIERFNGQSPEANTVPEAQPAGSETQSANESSPADSTPKSLPPDQQSGARRHAVWQRGNLEMYGAAQQWKLSQQTQSDSQAIKNQAVDTDNSAKPSFASQRRNAISRPAVGSDSTSQAKTPSGTLPIATPDTEPGASKSTTPKQSQPTGTPNRNKTWNYQYERSVKLGKSSSDQSADSSNSKISSTDDGFTHSKRRSNIARGSGGLTAYGEGKTTSQSGGAVKSWDKTFAGGENEKYAVKGEAAALEARSRTYKYDSGLGVGAQAEASLIRGKIGVQANTGHKVGNAEVVGASGNAEVDGLVGARATAEAGVGVGRDGLPAVRVGAEAFVGARVDARAGGEARLMGVGLDGKGSASTMAGAQASSEASLGLTGMEASVSAFAGASAGASGSASLAGVGASGSAEAWAGVGARAELDAGYTDGKLQFKFGLGAALGVGGAVGGGFTWDLNETKTDIERAAYNTTQLAASVGQTMTSTAGTVANTLTFGANAAGNVVNDGANIVANTAGNVVNEGTKTVAVVANTVEQTAAKTAVAAAKTVSNVTKSVGQAASNIAKSIFKF